MVGGAEDLGARQAAGGGGVEPVGPSQEQVPGGGVAGAPGAVRLGVGARRQRCHGDNSEPTGPERLPVPWFWVVLIILLLR